MKRVFQKELFRDAIAIIDGIPDKRVNLNQWQNSGYRWTYEQGRRIVIVTSPDKIKCGTIACAGGWLALHPTFRALGLHPEKYNGIPSIGRGDKAVEGPNALAILFGIADCEALALFKARSTFEESYRKTKNLTDRQLWLRRAKEFLADRDAFNMRRFGYLKYQNELQGS